MDLTTTTHASLELTRGARHDLPIPLSDEDGGGDCYPTDESEVGP